MEIYFLKQKKMGKNRKNKKNEISVSKKKKSSIIIKAVHATPFLGHIISSMNKNLIFSFVVGFTRIMVFSPDGLSEIIFIIKFIKEVNFNLVMEKIIK